MTEVLNFLILILGTINLVRMTVFIIGSDIYTYRAKKEDRSLRRTYPSFTVIIPAHNEEGTVLRAVRSVFANRYPDDKRRVVVADDGSTDGTAQVVREYRKLHQPRKLRLFRQPQSGKAVALNNALRHTRSELVMCLDADSYLDPVAMRKMAGYFDDPRVAAVSTNVKIIPRPGLLNLIQQVEYLICYQMKRAQTVFNIEYIIGGIGSTFRRKLIQRIGYYDADTVTEDIDLTMKILQRGNKTTRVIYGSDAIAHTEAVLDLGGLVRQRYRWKWGRAQTFLKNSRMFFRSDPRFTKGLTWIYLPYAIFGDLAFFVEPLLIGYIFYLVLSFGDYLTLFSTLVVMASYICLNIILEKTLTRRQKLEYCLVAPAMYLLFYLMSLVEYAALIQTLVRLPKLRGSVQEGTASWQHVRRLKAA